MVTRTSGVPWLDLAKRQAEEHLDRQAGLDGGVREGLLATALARRRRVPSYAGIEPDRQRPALMQRGVVDGPVQGAIADGRRLGHAAQLCRCTTDVNPRQALRNKAGA